MLKKLIGLIVLAMVLASCGEVLPGGNTVGSVTPVAETNQIKVSWTFTGDKATIDGFRIVRSVDGGSYAFLIDKLDPNATSHTDTNVEQGKTYKYGVAIIDSEGNPGSVVNQSGAGVSPKPVTSSGSMNGQWVQEATITKTPPGEEAQLGKKISLFLDITETSGVLTGTVSFLDDTSGTPEPGAPFGEGKIEGRKNSNGTYTFKLIEQTPTDTKEELSWTVTTSVNAGSTSFTGTYINVFGFEGTVVGTKVP